MSTPTGFNIPYMGNDAINPRSTFVENKSPTSNDSKGFKMGDRWVDRVGKEAYLFLGDSGGGAIWVLITGGAASAFKYLVGPVGSGAPYSTIQSAINAAVADGASASDQKIVWILPATYTESLSFGNYVHLKGLGSDGRVDDVTIVGQATANGVTVLQDVSMQDFSAFNTCITQPGFFSSAVILLHCQLIAGLACVNVSTNLTYCESCNFNSPSGSVFIGTGAQILCYFAEQMNGAVATFNVTAGTSVICENSSVFGPILLNASSGFFKYNTIGAPITLIGATGDLRFNAIQTALTSSYNIDAGSTIRSEINTIFCNAGSGFYAIGAGNLFTGGNVLEGTAVVPAGTLIVTPLPIG